MIPRRPSNLFRSRRTALLWAASVLATAVATVGFAPAPSDDMTDINVEALKTVAEGLR